MKVSVVVVSHDHDLRRCINALLAQDAPPQEIVLVEQGQQQIEKECKIPIRTYRCSGSVAQARDHGVRKAQNNVIMLVSPLTWLDEGCLASLKLSLDHAGCVKGRSVPDAQSEFEYILSRITMVRTDPCIAFSKKAWKAAGGFEDAATVDRFWRRCGGVEDPHAVSFVPVAPGMGSMMAAVHRQGHDDARYGSSHIAWELTGLLIYTAAVGLALVHVPALAYVMLVVGAAGLAAAAIAIFKSTRRMHALWCAPMLLVLQRIAYLVGFAHGFAKKR